MFELKIWAKSTHFCQIHHNFTRSGDSLQNMKLKLIDRLRTTVERSLITDKQTTPMDW